MGTKNAVMADGKQIIIRLRKKYYILQILCMSAVCMIMTGCTISLSAGKNTVYKQGHDQLSFFDKLTAAKTLETETAGETARLAESSGSPDLEVSETVEYPLEEIEALGIPENMLAYWMVLNSRKPFVSANEGCQEFFWNEYFWCTSDPDPEFTIYDFKITDLDNDGVEELVMVGFPETTQVLDYQEGTVYSYQFVYRGMARITVDGVYSSSSAFDIGGFHRIRFDKGTYEEETLAYMEHDYFEVEGEEVSSEEFYAYTEPIVKADYIKSMEFTEEMLDKILLGDLKEEELYLVRHVEPEKICDENNPRMADVSEPYLAVLTGTESFLCVTDGGQKYIMDGNCIKNQVGEDVYQVLYFSMADMEGDGEEEVVLTCAGKNLILHAIEDVVYGYVFDFGDEMGAIAKDGIFFPRRYTADHRYGKIISFEKDGCVMDVVEDYDGDDFERIRYYYFSEEIMAEKLAALKAPETETAGETERLPDSKPWKPETDGEAEYPSEEEIAALGIPEDMLAYWLVLNSKQPFISTNEGNQKFYWNEYYWRLGRAVERYRADLFMIVDMDGDGAKEIVLECSPETTQILHYEDGDVYSYQFVFRGMKRIHSNSIYEASDGAASTYYYRLTELNKEGYKEELLAVMDGDYYEVEGKEATYEEFLDRAESIESVALAEHMKFTEDMLDRQLLGNLSEQDLALVKRIPAEDMIENEPCYEEHKQALQLYAAVLTGKEEAVCVTEDTRPKDNEPVRLYFSIVDMDGDDVPELVFTCYFLVTQILHYEDGIVYCYQPELNASDTLVITTDGVFRTDDLSPSGYARIVSFEKDGCRIEPVEGYDSGSHDRIRYYYFSEETIARWLE